jgi:hypothetical protein
MERVMSFTNAEHKHHRNKEKAHTGHDQTCPDQQWPDHVKARMDQKARADRNDAPASDQNASRTRQLACDSGANCGG